MKRFRPGRDHAAKKGVIDGAVGLGHCEHQGDRSPGASSVHVGDEAGHFGEHAGGGAAGFVEEGLMFDPGAGAEVGFGGDGGEAVALDGEA